MALLKLKKLVGLRGPFSVWKKVLDLVLAEPRIIIPFAALAFIETVTLWILSCSPHFPVSVILAPPIKSVWGAIYLHYPYIYELLPRLFYYAKIVLGILFGSLTSAMAVLMVARIAKGRKLDIKEVFLEVWKRYLTLVILMMILFVAVHFAMKQPQVLLIKYFRSHPKLLFVGPKYWFNLFLPTATFALAVVLQGLFVYSIPYVIIKGKKFATALLSGFVFFFRNFFRTIFVVLVPMLLYIPITMMRGNLGLLSNKFAPEVSIAVLFAGILVGTVIVDVLVTIATTLVFLEVTGEK